MEFKLTTACFLTKMMYIGLMAYVQVLTEDSDASRSIRGNFIKYSYCTKYNEIDKRYSDVQKYSFYKNDVNNISASLSISRKSLKIHYIFRNASTNYKYVSFYYILFYCSL